ncbi:MAG TPA: long-chain fatty acid--CoA ligase [Streptosporangiaceae bacterium]|nr:long-chain fatty acid--CoA ligase [Streptosporangiaceae bacterium]
MQSTMMDIPLTVTGILRYGAMAYGDREVVTFTGDGVRRQTYAQTAVRSARLANALRGLGVDADQRVATLLWNNSEHLEAYLAVPSMGAVLHTLNLRLDPAEIAFIVNHAADHVVLVDSSLVPLLARVLPQVETVRHVVVTGPVAEVATLADQVSGAGHRVHSYEDLLAAASEHFEWPRLEERSAAAMCYTSGTTGRPKGVVYSHRSIYLHAMGVCLANSFGMSERDRMLPVVPMFHANAWGLPHAAFLAGADLVMPDRFLQPAPLVKLIETERPTLAGAVPTIWNGVLQYVREHGGDLSSLRLVVCGGSAVPHSLMEAFEKELGVRIIQAWGMTETSPLGSVAHPPANTPAAEEWHYRDTAGRFFCTVEARLVGDDDTLLPHDGEAVGEVEVRGPWVTGSYYQDPDPAKFHDGWLRTGDVGTISPDGFVTLTDRAKDVIKSGGEWISSMTLENTLMAHPDVAEAAVIGVPDDQWGERPLATVVLHPGASVTAADLRAFLADRIPRWQLPERWSFIDEVPKTGVGKFAKTRLRTQYANGDFEVITLGPTSSSQG